MRVLIATATAGGGHLAAASAISEAWSALRPDDLIEQVDLVGFFSPLYRKVHGDGYAKLLEHVPEVWGMVFEKTDKPDVARRLNKIKRLFPSKGRAGFRRKVEAFRPDVVLCTHYMGLEVLGQKTSGDRPFVVSVVTDFEAHALWMDEGVDLYCVAADHTRARLIARGAEAARVAVSGIPISSRFAKAIDAKGVRRQLGIRDDLQTVLVLSGGFGMGPVGEILAGLDRVDKPMQVVVVTGRNAEMRRELAGVDRAHPTHVLGFVSNMHELMCVADLIITKPGGLTSSEAMAMGKPLLVVSPIPGQETANSDFLLEQGAAAKVNRLDDLPFRVGELLGTRKLAEMSKAARALGRAGAASAICREVLRRVDPGCLQDGRP